MEQVRAWSVGGPTLFAVSHVMGGGFLLKVPGTPDGAPPGNAEPPGKLETQTVPKIKRARIRCPHCQWQPERASRWMCASSGAPEFFDHGCGHVWNTFDTRGICPGCSYQWKHTACPACSRWALHEDWYGTENTDGPR